MDDERLIPQQASPDSGGTSFLKHVEALKQRHGGGVSDFEPPRLDFVPTEPFAEIEQSDRVPCTP